MIQKTFPILILLILISVLVLSLFLDDDEPQRIEGSIMGTTYNVIVFSEYDNLLNLIKNPYNYETNNILQIIPDGFDDSYKTFCGT